MAKPRRTLVWTPEAEQDLVDIWTYLSMEATAQVAEQQLLRIDAACRTAYAISASRAAKKRARYRNPIDPRPAVCRVLSTDHDRGRNRPCPPRSPRYR